VSEVPLYSSPCRIACQLARVPLSHTAPNRLTPLSLLHQLGTPGTLPTVPLDIHAKVEQRFRLPFARERKVQGPPLRWRRASCSRRQPRLLARSYIALLLLRHAAPPQCSASALCCDTSPPRWRRTLASRCSRRSSEPHLPATSDSGSPEPAVRVTTVTTGYLRPTPSADVASPLPPPVSPPA